MSLLFSPITVFVSLILNGCCQRANSPIFRGKRAGDRRTRGQRGSGGWMTRRQLYKEAGGQGDRRTREQKDKGTGGHGDRRARG